MFCGTPIQGARVRRCRGATLIQGKAPPASRMRVSSIIYVLGVGVYRAIGFVMLRALGV